MTKRSLRLPETDRTGGRPKVPIVQIGQQTSEMNMQHARGVPTPNIVAATSTSANAPETATCISVNPSREGTAIILTAPAAVNPPRAKRQVQAVCIPSLATLFFPCSSPIIVSYDKFFVSLQELANSMMPAGWLENTVMELGIESIMIWKEKKMKKIVMPLRVALHSEVMHGSSQKMAVKGSGSVERQMLAFGAD